MNQRHVAWIVTRVLTGLLSAAVSLHAVYEVTAVDFRFNPVVTWLYCLFPGVCLLAFLFIRSVRAEGLTQVVLFLGYIATASILGWRNCSADGYCTTVTDTVWTVLQSKPALALLAVALLSLIAWGLGNSSRSSLQAAQ